MGKPFVFGVLSGGSSIRYYSTIEDFPTALRHFTPAEIHKLKVTYKYAWPEIITLIEHTFVKRFGLTFENTLGFTLEPKPKTVDPRENALDTDCDLSAVNATNDTNTHVSRTPKIVTIKDICCRIIKNRVLRIKRKI